jgi:hypothetical protein
VAAMVKAKQNRPMSPACAQPIGTLEPSVPGVGVGGAEHGASEKWRSWALVAPAYNPSNSGCRDQGDQDLKPAWATKPRPYLKNTQYKKGAGRVTQVVECLPSKCEVLSSNPSTTKKKKME